MENKNTEERPLINMVPFCKRHQSRLIHGANFKESDPWQALTVVAQIAMFQIATTKKSVQTRLAGDITKLPELGCLACRLPAAFDEVVNAAKGKDLGKIKELGERYIRDAAA